MLPLLTFVAGFLLGGATLWVLQKASRYRLSFDRKGVTVSERKSVTIVYQFYATTSKRRLAGRRIISSALQAPGIVHSLDSTEGESGRRH